MIWYCIQVRDLGTICTLRTAITHMIIVMGEWWSLMWHTPSEFM